MRDFSLAELNLISLSTPKLRFKSIPQQQPQHPTTMTHSKPWQTLFVVARRNKAKNIDLLELAVLIPHLANHDMVLVEMQPRLKAIRKSIRRAIRGPRHPCPPGAVCATCGSKPRYVAGGACTATRTTTSAPSPAAGLPVSVQYFLFQLRSV